MTNINSGALYDGQAHEMDVRYGTDLSVQGFGAGSYKVMGKLTSEMNYTEITGVAMGNNFPTATEITDEQIYLYDVSTLDSVTVSDVTGFTKITAVVINK